MVADKSLSREQLNARNPACFQIVLLLSHNPKKNGIFLGESLRRKKAVEDAETTTVFVNVGLPPLGRVTRGFLAIYILRTLSLLDHAHLQILGGRRGGGGARTEEFPEILDATACLMCPDCGRGRLGTSAQRKHQPTFLCRAWSLWPGDIRHAPFFIFFSKGDRSKSLASQSWQGSGAAPIEDRLVQRTP